MRSIALFSCFGLSLSFALGQVKTSGPATTKSSICSQTNTGNNNTFNITCGIGKEQGSEMLKILNRIIGNQIDPNAVMAKLDEILVNQKKTSEAISQIQSGVWKKLSDSEILAAVDALTPFAGQKVVLVVANQDADRMAVAQQLSRIFTTAKWDFQGTETPMTWGDPKAIPPRGIFLHVHDVTSAAQTLGGVLISLYGPENIPTGRTDEKFVPGLIEINIFRK